MTSIMKEVFYDWGVYNKIIFYYLNHLSNYGYIPEALKILSSLFQIENFAICYLILCLHQYYQLKITPKSDFDREFHRRYNTLVYIGTCYAFFGIVFAILKFSINLPRPFCSLPDGSFTTIALVTHERCLSSFPSAHTGLALIIGALSWRYLNCWIKILSTLVIMLVALSRITLAMHYPADILYSSIIVILVMWFSRITSGILRENIIRYFEGLIKRWLF